MTSKEAYDLLKQNKALVIDIREADELRESGTAEGAEWFPSHHIFENDEEWEARKKSLPKDKPIFMFCRSGGRVSRVAALLNPQGYQIENIGGFKDWKDAGLPVKPFSG